MTLTNIIYLHILYPPIRCRRTVGWLPHPSLITERDGLEFCIYDDANIDGRRFSPLCKAVKSEERGSVAADAKNTGMVSCVVTETEEPPLTFTIFDDGCTDFGEVDNNIDSIMSFHQAVTTGEREGGGQDEMSLYGRPFCAELSCIQESGTPTAEES